VVTHRAKGTAAAAAAAALAAQHGQFVNQEQYRQLLNDAVWSAVRQQLRGFEQALGCYQAAAAAQLDAAAAAAGGVGGEAAAWAAFVAMRRKQQLGL
jgi:hypothetical protein